MDIPLTAREAATEFGLRPKTTGMWASRGWEDADGKKQQMFPVDFEGRYNAARYWWSDWTTAELETRRKRNRSRRKYKHIPDLVTT